MRYVALCLLLSGITASARADIPVPTEPPECKELYSQQTRLQRQLFKTPEHEALRDQAVYHAWFATTRELDLFMVTPGSSLPPRMRELGHKLVDINRQIQAEPATQAVMSHPVCAQVTDVASAMREHGCFGRHHGSVFWDNDSPCLTLPAVFGDPAPGLLL